jgi:DNA-binding transcriptional MerR regulator
MNDGKSGLRIGEFARRVRVRPELLRAWEQRYGLLKPERTAGGYRLYSEADAERVARMRRGLEAGLSAAEAAQAALAPGPQAGGLMENAQARLLDAIERFDEAGVHAVLDETLSAFSIDAVLRDVVLPTLRAVGARWEQDDAAISQEHFASHLIRGRLLALARFWGRGVGPLALLACAPGEAHDITLLAFGLLLRSRGWRVLFLGANTPVATVTQTAELTDPAVLVVASFDPHRLEACAPALAQLSRRAPLVLAGPGATEQLCERAAVRRLEGDLIAAAEELVPG